MATISWKHFFSALLIVLSLMIIGGFQPAERRILGSFFTVDALVLLFTVFAVVLSDKLDQLINETKKANRNDNND